MYRWDWPNVNRVLLLGAHADDIEIGCGGTVLSQLAPRDDIEIHWVVFSGDQVRRAEAERSASAFLGSGKRLKIEVQGFRDNFFPDVWGEIKESMHELSQRCRPDIVFTHRMDDRHQDHRVIAELTWCTFRQQSILAYEIPKYEGDLGQPNVLSGFSAEIARRKAELIVKHFPSQQEKPWFSADTFTGLARIRGVETGGAHSHAEGFYGRKMLLV